MLDIFNIPGQQDNIKIFYARGTTDWQTWNKPRNCKFIWIMCIGAGNGGYGFGTSPSSEIGGGGSGAVTKALFPANVLPDTLFIQPGAGGTGGASSGVSSANSGNIGSRSYVSIAASSAAAMNIICLSGATPVGVGAGEGVATVALAGLLSLGNFLSVAGDNTATSTDKSPLTSTITCGGTANGTGNQPGRSIESTIFSPRISGGAIGGGNGGDGIWSWKPIFGTGGAGGGGNIAGIGGNGGNGGYGCGGGTGGYGNVAGGAGGKGGDGLVIIATF
jgi:hypothetical protein